MYAAPGLPAAAKQSGRSYDVDDRDFFWEAVGAHPFPRVAEEVETQLQVGGLWFWKGRRGR
jgi:hypothetical protein